MRVVIPLPPPMTKTLAQTKTAKVNELDISWSGEVEGKLLTEKVDVEERHIRTRPPGILLQPSSALEQLWTWLIKNTP
jgi:hypothetical protein